MPGSALDHVPDLRAEDVAPAIAVTLTDHIAHVLPVAVTLTLTLTHHLAVANTDDVSVAVTDHLSVSISQRDVALRRSLVTAALAVTVLALSAGFGSSSAGAAQQCGYWRWPVKTLSDSAAKKVDYEPLRRKVPYLRSLKPPSDPFLWGPDKPRTKGVERRTYRIHVVLRRAIRISDHDIRLIVGAATHPKSTIAVEFADPKCEGAARSAHRKAMADARHAVLSACPDIGSKYRSLDGVADIVGVGFWDSSNRRAGGAPSGLELHPALRFSGTCGAR